jgi:hypothetical protein
MTTPYFDKVAALTLPTFTVKRHKVCTTRAQHDNAISTLAPGDWIDCQGILFSGETIYKKPALTGLARITYDSHCAFTGTPIGSRLPSVWIRNCVYLQFVFDPACTIKNPTGGQGIRVDGLTHGAVDGFRIQNCATDGIDLFPTQADIRYSLIRGEVYDIAKVPSMDPHAEKGTGLHCCNAADTSSAFRLHDCDIAIYGHDCVKGGSVIEYGNPVSTNQPYGNRLYVKAHSMLQKATSQVAGNGVNLWGHIGSVDVKYVEADNLAGRAVDAQGGSGTWTNVKVQAGTALGCCQNAALAKTEPGISPYAAWDTRHGITYGTVQPTP